MSSTNNLAEKHRPLMFRDVIGQPMVANLAKSVGDNVEYAGDQAYLMTGLHGSGKTTTARILARALNCESLGADGEPCDPEGSDICDSCDLLLNGAWGEGILELDAASNNGVGDIRDLTSKTSLSTRAKRRVVLLDEVHALSGPAQQAFLKSLEEPTKNVTWVLCTTDPQKLAPTIVSRCVEIHMATLREPELRKVVERVVNSEGWTETVTDDMIKMAVARSGGSSRNAINSLQEVMLGASSDDFTTAYRRLDEAIYGGDASSFAIEYESVLSDEPSFNAKDYVQHIIDMLRSAMVIQVAEDQVDQDHLFYDQVVGFAERYGQQRIIRGIRQFYEVLHPIGIAGRNSAGILLGAVLVFLQPTAGNSMDSVLDALDDLNERLDKMQETAVDKKSLKSEIRSALAGLNLSAAAPNATAADWPAVEEDQVEEDTAEEEAEDTTPDPVEDEPESTEQEDQEDTEADDGEDEPDDEPEEEEEDASGPELTDKQVYALFDDLLEVSGLGNASLLKIEAVEDDDIEVIRKGKIVSKVVLTIHDRWTKTTKNIVTRFFAEKDIELEFGE